MERKTSHLHLYKKAPVTVKNSKGENISVMAYIMNNERNLAPVPPSISYYDGIEAGFKQNGLPENSLREALDKVWREYEVFQKKKHQQERRENQKLPLTNSALLAALKMPTVLDCRHFNGWLYSTKLEWRMYTYSRKNRYRAI